MCRIVCLALAPRSPDVICISLDGSHARARAECPLDARAGLRGALSLSALNWLLLAGRMDCRKALAQGSERSAIRWKGYLAAGRCAGSVCTRMPLRLPHC